MAIIKLKRNPMNYIKQEYERMFKEVEQYKGLSRVGNIEKDKEILTKIYKFKAFEATIEIDKENPDMTKDMKHFCEAQIEGLERLKKETLDEEMLMILNVVSGCNFNCMQDFNIFIESSIEVYKDIKNQL